jgi:hypothetical protein
VSNTHNLSLLPSGSLTFYSGTENIKHGIKQHDNLDIISDIINLGVIAPAELLGHGLSTLTMGGILERSTRKLIRAMTRSQQNMTVDLTVDNVR